MDTAVSETSLWEEWRRPVAVAAAALLVLAVEGSVGPRSRRSSDGMAVVHCRSSGEFLPVWRDTGARGRTLVHLVRRIAMDPGPEREEDGYLRRAVDEGIVRRVFHVIAEPAWPGVTRNLGSMQGVRFDGRRYHLVVDGAPVVVLRMEDLPSLDDRVLVTMDLDAYPEADVATFAARLARGEPRADVVAYVGARSSPQLDSLRDASR